MHRSASGSSDLSTLTEAPKAVLTPALATPASLSSLPLDDAQTDRWTRAGWTVASVRRLLDALLTWDYLPFCLMCKDPFLRDYYSGSSRYCSSALVNALLALATRVVHENGDEAESPGPGFKCGSKPFFDEADAIIRSTGPSASLPDIQAIGILALYQITCGREAEAQALADSFAARIADLCLQEPLVGSEADEYAKVRATSYCGAVSLIRYVNHSLPRPESDAISHAAYFVSPPAKSSTCRRITGCKTTPSFSTNPPAAPSTCSAAPLHQVGASERVPYESRGNTAADIALDARGSQLRNLQLIPARVFQLTEWVYKLSSATHIDTAEVMAVYTKCLDWYEGFFSLLKTDGSDTPFVLFIQ